MREKNIRYGRRRAKKSKPAYSDKLIRRIIAGSIVFFVCWSISATETPLKSFISKTLTQSSDTDKIKKEFSDLCIFLEGKYPVLKTNVIWQSIIPQKEEVEESPVTPPPEPASELVAKAAEEFTYPENIYMVAPLAGKVTSPFGGREHPVYGRDSTHQGVDIAGSTGDVIITTSPGKVVEVKSDNIHGNYVRVKHTERIDSFYAHMDTVSVKEGDILTENSQIGTVGSTGVSTGPHLHFGVYVDGVPTNPENYIKMEHK